MNGPYTLSRSAILFAAIAQLSCVGSYEPASDYTANIVVIRDSLVTKLTDSLSCGKPEFCNGESMLAYVRLRGVGISNHVQSAVVVSSLDGSARNEFLVGYSIYPDIAVSPNTLRAAVQTTNHLGFAEIYVVNLPSGPPAITNMNLTYARDISFSPNGESIVFVDEVQGEGESWTNQIVEYGISDQSWKVLATFGPDTLLGEPKFLPRGGLVYTLMALSDYTRRIVYDPVDGAERIIIANDSRYKIIVHPHMNIIAYSSIDEHISVISLEGGIAVSVVPGSPREPLQFVGSGDSLLVLTSDYEVGIATGSGIERLSLPSGIEQRSLRMSKDGSFLIGLHGATVYW